MNDRDFSHLLVTGGPWIVSQVSLLPSLRGFSAPLALNAWRARPASSPFNFSFSSCSLTHNNNHTTSLTNASLLPPLASRPSSVLLHRRSRRPDVELIDIAHYPGRCFLLRRPRRILSGGPSLHLAQNSERFSSPGTRTSVSDQSWTTTSGGGWSTSYERPAFRSGLASKSACFQATK